MHTLLKRANIFADLYKRSIASETTVSTRKAHKNEALFEKHKQRSNLGSTNAGVHRGAHKVAERTNNFAALLRKLASRRKHQCLALTSGHFNSLQKTRTQTSSPHKLGIVVVGR